MQTRFFFLLFILMLVPVSPVAGSLTKISAGAPVYIGEQNLNIAAGLQACRVIEWYEPGADTGGPAQKNVTIIKTLEDSDIAFSYTIKPEIYSGYEGNWYCEGKRPLRPVFEVRQPRIAVRFWDLDKDTDITGQTVPMTGNITFRIDTNMDTALQAEYRPEVTPLDSFYTVTLTAPGNKVLSSVYTGSTGKADTQGLLFDKKPFIDISPFYWKDGRSWDRTSRNAQGEDMYPPGTYTVSVKQNLNRMDALYTDLYPDERVGLLDATASVTMIKPASTFVPSTVTAVQTPSAEVTTKEPGTPVTTAPQSTATPARTTPPAKTTYAPLPVPLVVVALCTALFACASRRGR